MNLKLENIGIIKKANINIDGLVVIAGENDTGKSTLGKSIFALLRSRNEYFNMLPKLFKDNSIYKNSVMKIETDKMSYFRKNDSIYRTYTNNEPNDIDVIFVESPLVWNLQEFFNTTVQLESRLSQIGENISIPYPFLMKDLDYKLHTQKPSTINTTKNQNIKNSLTKIMNGEFVKNAQSNNYFFYRDKNSYNLINMATGIKYFGIIQVLIDNNRLNENVILILDEPEVHLHPKWQLKLAQVIISLMQNGIKIVINSHSPYMIEALQRYSKKENIESKTNFYLAENGIIGKIENNNNKTLNKIFEKLSEPFDEFDRLDSDELQNDRF